MTPTIDACLQLQYFDNISHGELGESIRNREFSVLFTSPLCFLDPADDETPVGERSSFGIRVCEHETQTQRSRRGYQDRRRGNQDRRPHSTP